MFGIPEWALGVGFIIVAVSIAKALGGRLGPPNPLGGPRRSRRDLAQAVEDLQKRVGGSDDVQTRLDALERSEEHTSELQSHSDLVCRLLLEKKKRKKE